MSRHARLSGPTLYINERILKKRLGYVDAGLIYPQIFSTLTVCLGSVIFGTVFGWGSPLHYQLPKLVYDDIKMEYEKEFVWIICLSSIAAAVRSFTGILNVLNLGPRKAMLLQAPFLILSLMVMAVNRNYKLYYVTQFFNGYFAFGYVSLGEKFLNGTVHRKYIKTAYILFKSSMYLGVLLMNLLGPLLSKVLLCHFCILLTVFCTICFFFLCESPVFLMIENDELARKALCFYRGKLTHEIEIIRNYISLQKSNAFNLNILCRKKVIYKSFLIIILMEILATSSGYHAFILDSEFMFVHSRSIGDPHRENVIYATVIVISCMIGKTVNVYSNLPLRGRILFSACSVNIVLMAFATYDYLVTQVFTIGYKPWIMLVTLCVLTILQDCGLNTSSELITYNYIPFQVYEESRMWMSFLHWVFIAILLRIHPVIRKMYGLYAILWLLSAIMFVCIILSYIYIIEIKDRSLIQIQIALGGNPIGNRGSVRQRIANPFEQSSATPTVNDLIKMSEVQSFS